MIVNTNSNSTINANTLLYDQDTEFSALDWDKIKHQEAIGNY